MKITCSTEKVDYEQSLFFLGPSSKTLETRKWQRAWLKARDGRGCRPRFSRIRCSTLALSWTPLTKSEEKESLLAVYGKGAIQWTSVEDLTSNRYNKRHSLPQHTGKNNRFPFLDILGYVKNTHKNPTFGRVRQVPIRELGREFPGWDLSHLAKFGIFMGIL